MVRRLSIPRTILIAALLLGALAACHPAGPPPTKTRCPDLSVVGRSDTARTTDWSQRAVGPGPQGAADALGCANYVVLTPFMGLSPATQAFRTVAASPHAPALFAALTRKGTTAGQLYGLAGLRLVDTTAFRRELPRFTERTESVHGVDVDIETAWPVRWLVRSDRGFRLRPGESLEEAMFASEDAEYDIYGGSITVMLMGRRHEPGGGLPESSDVPLQQTDSSRSSPEVNVPPPMPPSRLPGWVTP
jgi:hypothetical protein